ncbi:MAG TPA: Calx-beta domain-containing protein, partial [Gemmataceae bacterium]
MPVQPVASPAPTGTPSPAGTTSTQSLDAGGPIGMDGMDGDCGCCCDEQKVSIRAVDPTAGSWSIDGVEGTTTAGFEVYRLGDRTESLDVTYQVSGTAVAGYDYEALSGVVTIPAGEYHAGILLRALLVDDNSSGTVTIQLTTEGRYVIDPVGTAEATVSHEYATVDPPPTDTEEAVVGVTAVDPNAGELPGGQTSTGAFLFWRDTRSPGTWDDPVEVSYTVDPASLASPDDYERLDGAAIIAADTRAAPLVFVRPIDDTVYEGPEDVTVDVLPGDYRIGHGQDTVWIGDDDHADLEANPDTYAMGADQGVLYVPPRGVLCNDFSLSQEEPQAVAGTFQSDQGGEVDLNGDGSFKYFPPGWLQQSGGTDTFTYTAYIDGPNGPVFANAVVTIFVVKVDLQMVGVDPAHKLDVGGFVPVNANNDNGSLVTNEIPADRDFDAFFNQNGARFADPDLVPIDIVITPNVGLP